MPEYECEYCDETFTSPGEKAAHHRWEHEISHNDDENTDESENETKNYENLKERLKDIDSEFLSDKIHTMEVEAEDKGHYVCGECGEGVRPGQNCQSCGEELDW